MVNIDPAAWLELGLHFVGFNERRQKVCHKTNLERFVTHYGASPETHSAIFNDFQATVIPEAHMSKPDPLSLLMATYWLKTYPKEAQTAGIFKLDEKTVRKRVWKYVNAIAALKGLKVRARVDCNDFPWFYCHILIPDAAAVFIIDRLD